MALDWGMARIGVAMGEDDPPWVTPVTTLPAHPEEELMVLLARLRKEYEVTGLVIGLPLWDDQSSNATSDHAKDWGNRVAAALDLPFHFLDEGLTSERAHLKLLDLPPRKRREKGIIDALAAAIILEDYFSAKR